MGQLVTSYSLIGYCYDFTDVHLQLQSESLFPWLALLDHISKPGLRNVGGSLAFIWALVVIHHDKGWITLIFYEMRSEPLIATWYMDLCSSHDPW